MDNKVVFKGGLARGWREDAASSLYARDGSRKYLNRAERLRAIASMETLACDKRLFGLLLAWTGARPSEVLELMPISFQLDLSVVSFRTLKRRRFTTREVPVPPDLMDALDAHFGIAGRQGDRDLSRERLWPWDRVTGWRIVKEAMALAQIAGVQACPRGLRHAFGVGALQAGVPLNLIQRWLGHARLSTTAIYADASGPEELAFAERFWRSSEENVDAPCASTEEVS